MLSASRSSTVGSYLPIFGILQWPVHFRLIASSKKLTEESARTMITADAFSEASICQLPKVIAGLCWLPLTSPSIENVVKGDKKAAANRGISSAPIASD